MTDLEKKEFADSLVQQVGEMLFEGIADLPKKKPKKRFKPSKEKKKSRFATWLMVFACFVFFLIIVVDTVSWFQFREISGMAADGKWFFKICMGLYIAGYGTVRCVEIMKNGGDEHDS